MNKAKIQGAILCTVGPQWATVALVIGRVAHALGQDLPAQDEGYEEISKEIELLVQDRRLIAQGNIKNWRSSEVRRTTLPEISQYSSDN